MNEGDDSIDVQHHLAELSPPPSAYTADAWFTDPGGRAELRYTYERDGSMYAGGFAFERVRAYRHRAEGHCTDWHVDAYDTLVEVKPSAWVQELLDAEPSGTWGKWKIRHFLIYVDSAGAYEVAAEDWEQLPEKPATLTPEVASGRDHLLEALDELQRELESGVRWENDTLQRYLDSFYGLLTSIENVYLYEGEPVPTDPWVILAEVFRGARDYE